MPRPLPIQEAADALGVSVRTVRTWMDKGCPVARRGSRGRGNVALLDVEAIEAWRRRADAADIVRALAGEFPELVAEGIDEAFRLAEGPHKKPSAGLLVTAHYLCTCKLLDRAREICPDIPEPSSPRKIDRLRHIFEQSG